MKMWSGRFSKELDEGVNDFNSSISFDHVLYREDIEGSMAHAAMLGAAGIIPAEDAASLVQELGVIRSELDAGTLSFDPKAEDIHMFIEEVLTSRLGDVGKRLHTARSRNDQVALDLRLYLKNRVREIRALLKELMAVLTEKAERNLTTIMPGYTHLQIAQPVTFAHHLMAYAQMFARDDGRLSDCFGRMDAMPLGSGALASTTYPIDRERAARELGFAKITENSLDGVSDRDFCIELAAALSLVMTHLSRLSEEIVLWCSSEFRFVELDDAFATGSSIMPQKKNPDVAELVRGKTGRVNGNLVALLTVMKGLPLAYNKDMQEDKEAVFDSVETVKLCLRTMAPMLRTMRENPERMRSAAAKGFINATDCADYLTKKGMPFRDAYRITGQLVAICIERNETLETLPLDDYHAFSELFEKDLFQAIALETCVSQRKVPGGPAPSQVQRQIEELKIRMNLR